MRVVLRTFRKIWEDLADVLHGRQLNFKDNFVSFITSLSMENTFVLRETAQHGFRILAELKLHSSSIRQFEVLEDMCFRSED